MQPLVFYFNTPYFRDSSKRLYFIILSFLKIYSIESPFFFDIESPILYGYSNNSLIPLEYLTIERNIQNTQEKFTLEKNNDSIKIVGYDVHFTK